MALGGCQDYVVISKELGLEYSWNMKKNLTITEQRLYDMHSKDYITYLTLFNIQNLQTVHKVCISVSVFIDVDTFLNYKANK